MIKKTMLFLSLIVLLVAPQTWAAGTVTQTFETIASHIYLLTFTCTADSGDNSYPGTDSKVAIDGYVFLVKTIPDGTTAPTDQYDITFKDSDGIDIMGGKLLNRSDTDPEQTVPKIDAVYGSRWIDGIATLAITGNSVASAITVIKVFIYR